MALAILDLEGFEHGKAAFRIDTGTNQYYQLKIGRSVQRRSGVDWVDDIFFNSPVARNAGGGNLFAPPKRIAVPLAHLDTGLVYAQLFSYKNPEGKSPGFSKPVEIPMGLTGVGLPFSVATSMTPQPAPESSMVPQSFRPARAIPCRTYGQTYSQQASLEDLLSTVLKAAGPILLSLLKNQDGSGSSAASGSGAGSSDPGLAGILGSLLKGILGAIQTPASAGATTQSVDGNRFIGSNGMGSNGMSLNGSTSNGLSYSSPFIFGIDDALIGTLAGPILNVLPQLMNAANQQRLQMKQADNKLMTDLVSDVNRRLLLQTLMQAQAQKPPANGSADAAQNPDLSALIALLQQAPAATPGAATATAKSFSARSFSDDQPAAPAVAPPPPPPTSNRAVLTAVTSAPLPWNGKQAVLFVRNRPVQLKLRLDVTPPAPSKPLAKAIFKVTFKKPDDQSVYMERTLKQKDVAAGSTTTFNFSPSDLASLPVNRSIAVLAEIRWKTGGGARESKALGSLDVVFINQYFVKEQGTEASVEKELTDMQRYRAFWNKVWESPSLDAASGSQEDKKYLWELDVNAKYSVLLSPTQSSNGLMQTKILRGPVDKESITDTTSGRLKGGVELSMSELNKLLPLWDGATPLEAAKLEALSNEAFARNNGGEFLYHIKIKGKAAERGMVWIIPVFKLFEITLNNVSNSDETGQVTAVTEEKIRFPLPVSGRVLGLKSA
jgi:hypothetical protein